jgi:Zn ribbon nucleic-acid-binding protein
VPLNCMRQNELREEMSNSESSDLPKTEYVVTTCPVCLSHDFRPIHLRGKIPLVKCANCALHMQQPQPSDTDLNEIYGPNYFIDFPNDKDLDNHVGKLKNSTARLQLEDLRTYSAAKQQRDLTGMRLLEIGPGHGYMLQEAKRCGLDIRDWNIRLMPPKWRTRILAGTMYKLARWRPAHRISEPLM